MDQEGQVLKFRLRTADNIILGSERTPERKDGNMVEIQSVCWKCRVPMGPVVEDPDGLDESEMCPTCMEEENHV